jgi:hypothetical protein
MNKRVIAYVSTVWLLSMMTVGCGTSNEALSESSDQAKQAIGEFSNWFSIGPKGFNNNFNAQGASNWTGRILDYEWGSGLIAASRGGLWKAGNPASPISDGKVPTLVMNSVATKPGVPLTIVVGTGEATKQYGAGIWYTTNGGNLWSQAQLVGGGALTDAVTGNVFRIKFNPLDGTQVHAVCGRGYFRSLDSGGTWTRINVKTSSDVVSDIAINPLTPSVMYVAVQGAGIYKTTAGGSSGTWSNTGLTSGFPATGTGRISIALAPSAPNRLYAQVGLANDSFDDVYTMLDNGSGSWTHTNLSFFGAQASYNNTIAVSPTDSSIVLAGSVKLYRYNGSQWSPIDSLPNQAAVHNDMHVITWGPAGSHQVIVGNDGGLSSSSDDGITWISSDQALPFTQFYDMDLGRDAPTSDVVLGSAQDLGIIVTTNSGQTWTETVFGDGLTVSVDPTNSHNMWYTDFDTRREYSSDQGQHWAAAWGGIPCTNGNGTIIKNDQVAQVYIYTNNSCNGSNDVYKSIDFGTNWSVLAPAGALPGPVAQIAVPKFAPALPNVYAVISGVPASSQVWRHTTSPVAWVNASGGLPVGQQVDTVVPHPTNIATLYAVMTGDAGATKVWRTRDSGATWVNISGNLPNDNGTIREVSTSLAVHPGTDATIFLGTKSGVYVTTNANDAQPAWSAWNRGMIASVDGVTIPLAVSSLKLIDRRSIDSTVWLIASTFGRSIFERGAF